MNRPILLPGLPRIWRGPREIQFGSDPSRALTVELPDPRAARILDLLDGTRSARAILLRGAELGIPADHARALLDALQAAALVLPAPELLPTALPHESRRRLVGEAAALAMTGKRPADTLSRRAGCRVLLTGHGRLGAPIAVALAEAGIGHIEADVPGTVGPGELTGGPLRGPDIGRPRREAISDAVLRAAPHVRSLAVRNPAANLAVRRGHDGPSEVPHPALQRGHDGPPEVPHPAVQRGHDGSSEVPHLIIRLGHALTDPRPLGGSPGVPHLAVAVREGVPLIGPFVPAAGGPCLRCLDLHRQDRDAAWPGPRAARSSTPSSPAPSPPSWPPPPSRPPRP